jgi:hypothetical protein
MFDKQQYLDNEDNNYHTENGIALANEFGTPEEQKLMMQIQKDHYARGHINPDEIEARNAIVKKYYPMLEGLDEGMMSDMEKDLIDMYKGDGEPGLADAMGYSEAKFAKEYVRADADIYKMIKNYVNANESVVSEAGGYYTQPVYDMIEKHGIQKVMHELLTSLDADVIQDFISRAEFTESDETKYGIVRYPDTAISYIKNDGNGWEHIFDKSYGFEGPVDKADLQYAKKIDKEKIPSRMFGMNEAEKRWKQTSMSPEQAEEEYGKENVKVKRGGLRNGDDMVQVFVEDRAKGIRGALSKLPHIGRHIHGHDHKPSPQDAPDTPPSLKGIKIVPNPNKQSPQDAPPTQPTQPSEPAPSPQSTPPTQPTQPSEMDPPQAPTRKPRRPRNAIYASKMASAGKLKEKIFQAAKENEQQINELDLYAPNTDYIRAPNGEYFKVEYRNTGTITGGGRKAGDLTSFKSVVKADPKEVDVLDLEGRLNYADTDGSGVKSKKSNTIHTGHDHQGGGPLGGKDISVYDMDSEEYHDNVPDGAKGAVIKFMTAQQDESAKSERRLRIADWIQTRKQ